jgi:hypothetical protein
MVYTIVTHVHMEHVHSFFFLVFIDTLDPKVWKHMT